MGSKCQLPLDFFESVGICDGAPSNVSCVCYAFLRGCLYVPCGHLLGKGWPLGSRLWCQTASLSLSLWYPGSGVVLDCINSWSLHPYLLCQLSSIFCFSLTIIHNITKYVHHEGDLSVSIHYIISLPDATSCDKKYSISCLQIIFLFISYFKYVRWYST